MSSSVSQDAAEWLVRLEGPMDIAIWNEFETWIDADVRHKAAFIRLRVMWNRADVLRHLEPSDGMINADLLNFEYHAPELVTRKTVEREVRNGKKIARAPGFQLATAAEFLLTRASYKRYVQPIIADMQEEYIDCIAHGRERKARWVAVRGHFLVVPSWIYAILSRVAKRFLSGA